MDNSINKVVVNSKIKPVNNIISAETLRDVQRRVLTDLKDAIVKSMGPAGSNTLILRGNDDSTIVAEYSKDGNKIIKHIKYSYPIEMSIKSEIENATRHIEKTVGDGTSSIVVMSSLIFDAILALDSQTNIMRNPYQLIRNFKDVVSNISDKIRALGKEADLDDIYNIAYISTNGNDEIATQIRDIYKDYGMNVFIDVSASTNENTYLKTYDGVTIESGYADPCMINNIDNGDCRIRGTKSHPIRVYHFADPIDTPEQLAFFTQIIETNVMEKRFREGVAEIPTVILAPQISRDAQSYMRRINQMMNQFGEEAYTQKPQLLIITNYAGLDENYVDHISTLCGCKPIKKYIDNKIQAQDQKSGLAPTLQTVCDNFYGTADEVVADSMHSKFIAPKNMYDKNKNGEVILDENGTPVFSKVYKNIINFIEAEYKSKSEQGGNAGTLGSLKRQLNAIKSNMVELFIGGISISDRDSLRDLVEDAVLNCRSAAKYGVGYGANINGLLITDDILNEFNKERESGKVHTTKDYDKIILVKAINQAYYDSIVTLYETIVDREKAEGIVSVIRRGQVPYNISTGLYDGKVLTSIESEPAILDTISKILSIMITSNQVLVQAPTLSSHY